MKSKILLIAVLAILFVGCGQAKKKVNNNNPANESAIAITDEGKNEPKDVWTLISITGTSKEHPDEIQLEEDEVQKFKELYFAFSKDTLVANDKYKALTTRETIDSRKFFRRNYVYDFYVDFFNRNMHSDISKKLVYLNVSGIDQESITFFKFLNRINFDDPAPILSNDQIIVSYFGHILIYGKGSLEPSLHDETKETYLEYEFGDEDYKDIDKENHTLTAKDSIYTSNIRPGENLPVGKIYTDNFEFLSYSDEGDDLTVQVLKEDKIYSFIANELRDIIVSDPQFKQGDRLRIEWKIDFLTPAGDSTVFWVVKFAEKITKIKR